MKDRDTNIMSHFIQNHEWLTIFEHLMENQEAGLTARDVLDMTDLDYEVVRENLKQMMTNDVAHSSDLGAIYLNLANPKVQALIAACNQFTTTLLNLTQQEPTVGDVRIDEDEVDEHIALTRLDELKEGVVKPLTMADVNALIKEREDRERKE